MARNIAKKMQQIGIKEDELEEKFIHASAKGGQNVNKVATCVYLKHKPTGIEVKCSKERSQSLNRLKAREILADKIKEFFAKKHLAQKDALEKNRRKNRKRSQAAKERMLHQKKIRSEKKRLRQKHIKEDY